MKVGKRILKDLSFVGNESEQSVFTLIDRTTTFTGRDYLTRQLSQSPSSVEALIRQQEVVKFWSAHMAEWPEEISNGTIVMLEKFYETADNYSDHPGGLGMLFGKQFQKLLNRNQYFFTQFSLTHLSDFLKGCSKLVSLRQSGAELPVALSDLLGKMEKDLEHRLTERLIKIDKNTSYRDLALLAFHARREMKATVQRLIESYSCLDAWHSMAIATREHHWVFPEILAGTELEFSATGLYHPLIKAAVGYNVSFSKEQNFMILTGANMSGKTTFMRSLGVAAMLAHLGMGVPAAGMRISFMEGIITNMHVEDNLLQGESFFLSEVRSMKQTADQVVSGKTHLVLMDELFKGTNVHDAYECTRAIVEGLLLHPQHIMILSTHLYEVAHHFSAVPGLMFYYFTTSIAGNGDFEFNYRLLPGISDDRIGYRILVREGIVDILKQHKNTGH